MVIKRYCNYCKKPERILIHIIKKQFQSFKEVSNFQEPPLLQWEVIGKCLICSSWVHSMIDKETLLEVVKDLENASQVNITW